MRRNDYFDLSSGHKAELEGIKGLDTRPANYALTDTSTLSTPSINKFYYDKEVKDIGFITRNSAYQETYSSGFKNIIGHDDNNRGDSYYSGQNYSNNGAYTYTTN